MDRREISSSIVAEEEDVEACVISVQTGKFIECVASVYIQMPSFSFQAGPMLYWLLQSVE